MPLSEHAFLKYRGLKNVILFKRYLFISKSEYGCWKKMSKTICAYIPPETSFRGLRFVGTSLGFWPLKKTSEKWFLKLDYWFWFPLLNYVLIMFPLCYGFCLNRNNIVALSYSWLEVVGFIEVIAVIVFSKYKRSRLQVCKTYFIYLTKLYHEVTS